MPEYSWGFGLSLETIEKFQLYSHLEHGFLFINGKVAALVSLLPNANVNFLYSQRLRMR